MPDEPNVGFVVGSPPRLRDFIQEIAPAWLQRWWGRRLLYSFGLACDSIQQAATDGMLARLPGYPDATNAPPDALGYIGKDRQLVRGALESSAAFADRCRTAFDSWYRAGSMEGTLRQVQALYSPASVPVLEVCVSDSAYSQWATIPSTGAAIIYSNGDPAAWNWDNDPTKWARVWIIVHVTSATWPPVNLGLGHVLGAANWCIGIGVPKARVDDLKTVVSRWKSAATVAQVVLSYNPAWPLPTIAGPAVNYPDGSWGRLHVWTGAVSKPSRYSQARFLEPLT